MNRELKDILKSFDMFTTVARAEMGEACGAGVSKYASLVRERLIVSWDEYGDGTRTMRDLALLNEIECEALDLVGWAMFMWERDQCQRAVDLYAQAYAIWLDIEAWKLEVKNERR